jgi:hypothetical protein
MNKVKKKSRGNVIPFFVIIIVAFGLIGFLLSGFSATYGQQVDSKITGYGELNYTSPLNNTIVTSGFNTCTGLDVVCNFGNVYKVLSVNSSDPLFIILIISPIAIIGGIIILWWIRGISL